jgi:uncharacterized protein YijF (DUF1287 family)
VPGNAGAAFAFTAAFFVIWILCPSCGQGNDEPLTSRLASPGPERSKSRAARPVRRNSTPRPRPAPSLGIKDRGVFSRFDPRVRLRIPANVNRNRTSILINKAKRILVLKHRGVPVKVYPVALGFNPKGHKVKLGDGRTPEGKYYISEALHRNLARKYGARSLRLSYPNIRDGQRGLRRGLISPVQLQSIRAAVRAARTPPQNTALGSSIRIHGGGVGTDWTAGCIAMRDADIIELYKHVKVGTPVEVRSRSSGRDRDRDGIPDQVDILIGARKAAFNGAKYQGGYHRMKYPMGDVPASIGVCTDVIVRAVRNAGIDLQKLLHEHIKRNPRRYPWIRRPDPSIDQRRVKNLLVLFRARYKLIGRKVNASTRHRLMPGDIVLLDTLSKRGPDHIGIITDTMGRNGYPTVINNWTYGYTTSAMDLLPHVPVTHHFRIR